MVSLNKTRLPLPVAHQDASTTLSATYEDTTIDFFETNMDNMDQYQIVDTYLLSIISLSFIFLFIYLKFDAAWSKNTCLMALAIVWIILELLAFILLSLQMSKAIKLPRPPLGSMCEVLITLSLWGIGTLQVSEESATRYELALRCPYRSWRSYFRSEMALIWRCGQCMPLPLSVLRLSL
jgi:hypothetical protein